MGQWSNGVCMSNITYAHAYFKGSVVSLLKSLPLIVTLVSVGAAAQTISPQMLQQLKSCLLYTSPSPRDRTRSRMPSSA